VAVQDSSARSGLTVWTHARKASLGRLLTGETGSAAVLLAAIVVALVWINVDQASYDRLWQMRVTIAVGGQGVSQDLRQWVNNGLMTLFFFVVGLEARRQLDIGELRQRRRVALPILAGIGGMVTAVAIYVALNSGRPSVRGWGAAMSTDTAFALGLLALVGPRFGERLRAFMVTFLVVDDIIALAVIALAYSGPIAPAPLLAAILILGLALLAVTLRIRLGIMGFVLAAAAWVAFFEAGVDPIVVGLAAGLMAYAYPAGRGALESATDLFRSFREQPTPELARSAQIAVRRAVSPNERLQHVYYPWTQYVIVPLFALANAGIAIDGRMLAGALTSPIFIGIVLG
jgi:Na+/H+ antiporter NhaA